MTIPFHPLSEIFPLIEGEEFAELVNDIKTKGQLEPIVLYEEKILEGRNRYRACLMAGVEPITKQYDGTDPVGFIFSANFVRRHLTVGQRALVATQFTHMRPGAQPANLQNQRMIMSVPDAAKMVHVSPATVHEAKVVVANGTPEEIAQIKDGKISVSHVAKAIRARRASHQRGARIKTPDGFKTLLAAIKSGIELERDGNISAVNVAKKIGVASHTYVCLRDAILLSKRKDLSDRDLEVVQIALAEMDKTRRIKHLQELVKPISLKVWGRNGNRFKSDKTRLADFRDSIVFIVTGCSATAELEIPTLEKEQRAKIIKDVNSAITALIKLRRRLKREGN
jgi:hypothetical protein